MKLTLQRLSILNKALSGNFCKGGQLLWRQEVEIEIEIEIEIEVEVEVEVEVETKNLKLQTKIRA